MSEQNNTSDIDQKLAQKVKAIMEENRPVLSADDYLIDQIVDYKRYLYQTFENELPESREKSWRDISSSIQRPTKDELKKTTVKSLFSSTSTIWKAAAVFVIAAMLSIFLLRTDFNKPEVVAQSVSEQITYTLNDGSIVQLRPHSTLSIVTRSDTEVRYTLKGEAYFNVTKNTDRRFYVDAGHAIIEVVGTTFNVREWSDDTVVYLEEGSVLFSASNGSDKVVLKPGEMAAVSNNFSISDPVKTDGRQFISWQQNELVFENRTVESIIQELEHHYSINILAPDSIKNEILGGTLSLENRSVSLENLGIVLGGNFSSLGDKTYQFTE